MNDGLFGTGLQIAALEGHTDIVKRLLDEGADPNEDKGRFGTPLQLGVIENRSDVLRALLNSKVSVTSDTLSTVLRQVLGDREVEIETARIFLPDHENEISPEHLQNVMHFLSTYIPKKPSSSSCCSEEDEQEKREQEVLPSVMQRTLLCRHRGDCIATQDLRGRMVRASIVGIADSNYFRVVILISNGLYARMLRLVQSQSAVLKRSDSYDQPKSSTFLTVSFTLNTVSILCHSGIWCLYDKCHKSSLLCFPKMMDKSLPSVMI